MKGGQRCGGRNAKMVTELQLYFALLPNGKRRIYKKGLVIKLAEREGIKTHNEVVTPIEKVLNLGLEKPESEHYLHSK